MSLTEVLEAMETLNRKQLEWFLRDWMQMRRDWKALIRDHGLTERRLVGVAFATRKVRETLEKLRSAR